MTNPQLFSPACLNTINSKWSMWWLWASQCVLPLLEAWGWCGQLLGLSKATLPSIQLSFPSQMGLNQMKTSLRLSFGKQQAHVSSSIRIPHPGLEERLGSWAPCLGTAGNWRRNCSHAGSNPTDHSRGSWALGNPALLVCAGATSRASPSP